MTKYEIFTDRFEFRMGTQKHRIPDMSAHDILDTYLSGDDRITSNCIDPEKEASFDTLAEAKAEFSANYANYGSTSLEKVNGIYLMTGSIAWIEANEYDDGGEFDQGGGVVALSAEPYVNEED